MTDRSRQDAGSSTTGGNGSGASESTPLDGGGFLLQLLRRAPQSQTSATSPHPIGGRSYQDGHYVDPAVAAVGPAYPFYSTNLPDVGRHQIPSFPLPNHLHQGPWPSSTPPSAFSPPRFSPPRFSPPGFSHSFPRGNRGSFLQNEGRQLRLNPGNFDSAELNRNPSRNVQQRQNQHLRQSGGFPVQSSESAIVFGSLTNKQSHEHGRENKKGEFSVFPAQSHTKKIGDSGFAREGFLLSGLRGEDTCSSDTTCIGQVNANSHTQTGEYAAHGRVIKPASYPGKQLQYDGSMKTSGVTELSKTCSTTETQNGSEHYDFVSDRMIRERIEMVTRHELQSKEDQHSAIHYMKRRVAHKQILLDTEQEQSAQLLENGRTYNQESDFDEPIDAEAEQERPGLVHECENGLDEGSFPSKFTSKQLEQDSDSLTLIEEHIEKSELKNVVSRRNKDARFDFSRGHNVSNQRMRYRRGAVKCRYDIRRLTSSFLSVYESLVPAEEEKAKQKQLLLLLEKLVIKEWPSSQLHVYGSCANSFGVSNSDVDICLEIDDSERSKPEILLKLAEILQSDNLQNVQALIHARVPIVKLMDPLTGISCDICINNLLAVVNTKLLRDYAQIDERLRQLAFLIKFWAKSRGVNETYQGTLSSYAYVLMCIHFLQTRKPPILPCLQIMEATYAVTVDDIDCAFFDQVEKLHDFGAHNKESVAELLWGFFNYWGFVHDYANSVISVRTGGLISKQEKDWTRRIGNDRHLICIEDPFEISHDLGRVVDKHSIRILREEFERAANILQFDHNPSMTLFERYRRESSG